MYSMPHKCGCIILLYWTSLIKWECRWWLMCYCRILQGQGHNGQQQGSVLAGGVGREDSVLVKCSRSPLLITPTRPHDKLLCIFSDCSVTRSPANLTDQRNMQTKFHLRVSSGKQTFLLYSQLRRCRFLTDSNISIYTKTNLSIFRTT